MPTRLRLTGENGLPECPPWFHSTRLRNPQGAVWPIHHGGKCRRSLYVVDALDIEDAGDAPDSSEDVLELLSIFHVERHVDARADILATAFECPDVRAGFADHAGDRREHAGAVLGKDAQADRKGGVIRFRPFDRDAPLGFVEKIFYVGANFAV